MAILTFLFRIRIAVLALLGMGTAGAAWFAFHGHAVAVPFLLLSAASVAVVGIVGYFHLRHAGLAVLGALAPLPGMIAAAPIAMAHGVALGAFLEVYALSALVAAHLCGAIERRILDAAAHDDAARASLVNSSIPLGLSVLATALLLYGWYFHILAALTTATIALFAAGLLSAFIVTPVAAATLPFGEAFFVAANRARERRENALVAATLVVEPRWAFAWSGAVLVLATLGWFGAEHFLAGNVFLTRWEYWLGSALWLFLAVFAAGRDWRDALAAVLGLSVLALIALYLCGRATGRLMPVSMIEIFLLLSATLYLVLMVVVQSRRYRLAGDVAAVARLRAIEDAGWSPWFGALGAAGAIVPWLMLHGSLVTLVVLIPLACAMALAGVPALATALESLIPRRRSLSELYGRG